MRADLGRIIRYKMSNMKVACHDVGLNDILPHREPTTLRGTDRHGRCLLAHGLTHLLEVIKHRCDHVGNSFGGEENQPGPLRTMLESDRR